MKFFDSVSQGWGFIKEALKMGFENKILFAPSIYLVVTTVAYIAVWIGVFIAVDVDVETNQGLATTLGILCTFGSFLVFYFFQGMTVNMVDAHLEGKEVSVSEALRDARQNFLAIVVLAVISTIVQTIVSALRGDEDGGNLVGRIVGSIVEAVWTVVTFLMLPAIIIEDIGVGDALRRVRHLHRDNLLLIGVGEVGVRAISNLIGLLVFFGIFGVLYVSIEIVGGTAGVVMAIGISGLMLSVFAAFSIFVRMAYYTCLYLWASGVEKQGPDATPPLPLARALKRSR